MNTWFTSDMHLGHGNIIGYCNRPFRDAEHMNESLIRNWNSRVKEGDVVFHLGDFCCKGAERGVAGCRTKAEEWVKQLNGQIIHIRGNHDANNTVKVALDYAVIEFSNMRWLLVHRPPWQEFETLGAMPKVDVVLCGHVHDSWLYESWQVPVINVGVDRHKFAPLNKNEVTALYHRWKV